MPTDVKVELPRNLDAPGMARAAVSDELADRVDGDHLANVRLLVSELVTNGVKYGGDGPVLLEVTTDRERLRAEIVDSGGGFEPVARDGDLERPGGWGLHLVDELADRWGTYEGSTHVWFEIDLEPRSGELAQG